MAQALLDGDRVFVLELKAGGRVIRRLAHTHSRVDPEQKHDYWAERHATANSDLTRILFTSDRGRSGSEQVDVYPIEPGPIRPEESGRKDDDSMNDITWVQHMVEDEG